MLLANEGVPWFGKKVAAGRTTASAERDVVVVQKAPERGLRSHVLLTASPRTYYVVQYWESKEKAGRTRQRVGLWHEAYVVPEGSYESIYADMPAFGLAVAHGQVPVAVRGRYAKERFAYRSGESADASPSVQDLPRR